MRVFFSLQIFVIGCVLCVTTMSCARANSLAKSYGDDVAYFKGLRALEQGSYHEAENLFLQASKKGREDIRRVSLEELCALGSSTNRQRRAFNLYQKYQDEDALCILCRELFSNKGYEKIQSLTEDINLKDCDNQLAFYRLASISELEQQSDFVEQEILTWYTGRPFTELHAQALERFFKAPPPLIMLRKAVYERNYARGAVLAKEIIKNTQNLVPQIVSDIGKALLYSQEDAAYYAEILEDLVQSAPKESMFYLYFYTGRLYDKANDYQAQSLAAFKRAIATAPNASLYDNALWYHLNAALKDSIATALAELRVYCHKWKDASYFDDFLETLSVRMITKHLWEEYYNTALLLDGHASADMTSQYSYIAGRLIEEHFFTPKNRSAVEACLKLYSKAVSEGSDLYYFFLAAKKVGLSNEDMFERLSLLEKDSNFAEDEYASYILQGYVDFKLASRIHPFWKEHYASIKWEVVKNAATFLLDCAKEDETFYTQSLQMASRKFYLTEDSIDKELMCLSFPLDFYESVKKHCKTYGTQEYLLYALIRSESFFNPTAVSSAGATGLTQFMKATADEVAQKVHRQPYDLTDSDTSIEFGAYYIAYLQKRLNDIPLFASFAYNAGASKVSSWRNTVNLMFEKDTVPNDLFLEAVPITETRKYGRKILSAAVMYGILYYGKTPTEVIQEIFGEN